MIAASDHKMAKFIQEGFVRIEDSPDVGLGRRCASLSIDAATFMKVIMFFTLIKATYLWREPHRLGTPVQELLI